MMRVSDSGASPTDVKECEITTTSGVLALVNLQAQIDGLQQRAAAGGLAVSSRVLLIELVALRGQVLGCIADYERAEELAEQLTRDAPTDALAFIARAHTRATFHRFKDALSDLDDAQRLGADPTVVEAERAAIFQAVGRYDDALTIYRDAADRRANFNSLGALATLYAERGETTAAERLFDESRDRYRGVSPFPLALLDFQRGLMWLTHGDLQQARAWFSAAHRRLPVYVPAQGHLAEVEAALGEIEAALAHLHPLTISSDDPDYAAQLARILNKVGRLEEASCWRARAAARYDELIARHPEAFADHAAEFWLEAGADPQRALWLAQKNVEVRQTPRAHELLRRATRETCSGLSICSS
jgi:tetratricopeptide (TPR) repeat protein